MDMGGGVLRLLGANGSTPASGTGMPNDSVDWVNGTSAVAANASVNATGGLSVPEPTTSLAWTIFIDLSILGMGVMLWKAMRCCHPPGPPASGRGDQGQSPSQLSSGAALSSTVARNYVCFLKHCRDTFVALTVLSAAATVPYWGLKPISIGLTGTVTSTTVDLKPTGLAILCLDTAVRGLVALVFVERLQRRIQKPVLSESADDSIKRTLWLRDLPVYDSETGKAFEFREEDFKQVAQDLEHAIRREFRQFKMDLNAAGMKVYVAPVMNRWYEVSLQLRNTRERLSAYEALGRVYRPGICGCLSTAWYARQSSRYKKRWEKLDNEREAIEKGPKRISGTAFITFDNSDYRDHFLRDKPRCWQCRHHTFFSFGRPPFASATLACSRAPHPDDVNWINLHMTKRQRYVRFTILTFLLLITMVVLVTPVSIASQLQFVIREVEERLEKFATTVHAQHTVDVLKQFKGSWMETVSNHAPALVLLAINSLLLPELIYRISVVSKPHRKSSVEVIQLHLNAFFLIFNSMVIPFFEWESMNAVLVWAEVNMVGQQPSELVQKLVHRISSSVACSTGVFALRYIVNCACLTNLNSLLQIPQILCRAHARMAARTARESVDAEERWVFAWGYWYAWTISIFTLGICMSTAVPSALPCAALFFTLQHGVDSHNLAYKIYQYGPDIDTENLLATRILHYMRCVIALWWASMGLGFNVALREQKEADWDSSIPKPWIRSISVLLVVLSVLLVVFSCWTQQSILHDNAFKRVDFAQRGLASAGGGVLQPLCAWIEECLKCGERAYRSVQVADCRMERVESLTTEYTEVLDPDEASLKLCWDARSVAIQPFDSRPL